MAKGIDISIFSDTREFVTGVKKGVIEPLGDAADMMQELTKDGDRAGDRITRSMEQAQQAVSRFKGEQKEVGHGFNKMADDANESMDTVKRESLANMSETFSSFDGSVTGLLDGVQGTFGGVIADLGPAGMAIGAAGAAAIGLISMAFDQSAQHSEAFKAKVAELAQQLIDTGNSGPDAIQAIVDRMKQLATSTDDNVTNLSKLQKSSANSVTSYKDVAQAITGLGANIDDIAKRERDRYEALKVQEHNSLDWTAERSNAQKKVVEALEESAKASAEAQAAQAAYVAAGGPELEQKRALIDQLNSAYDDAAGSVDNYVNAETGVFDTARYIDAMNSKLQALGEYQTLLAQSTLSSSAKTYLTSLGQDAAAELMQAYKSGTDQQKQNLDRIWSEAGRSNSAQYVTGVRNAIPDRIDKEPKVGVDTGDATRQLDNWINDMTGRKVDLQISGRTVTGVRVF